MSNIVNQLINDRKIEFGGKTYEIHPNMEKSFKLAKYRNRQSLNLDITEENRDMVAHVLEVLEEAKNSDMTDGELLSKLSPEEIIEFTKMTDSSKPKFSLEECTDIVSIVLEVTIGEAKDILNAEFEINGFELLLSNVNSMLSMVFMNAKPVSIQAPKAKNQNKKVAKKAE